MRSTIPVFLLTVLAATARLAGQVALPDETFPHDETLPAAGTWVGNIQVGGTWRYVNVRVEHDEDGWSGKAIVATFLAMGSPLGDIAADGSDVAFTIAGQAATARLEGTIAPGGQRFTGTAKVTAPGAGELEGPFEMVRTVETMTLPRAMAFTGETELPGVVKFGVTIALAPTPGGNWLGHLDVPAQMTHGLILADVESDGTKFTATVPGPTPARLELALDDDTRRLTGTMKQGLYTLQMDLSRDDAYIAKTLRRPQHPRPPFPYRVEDVTIEHHDGHTLAGTLTLPDPEKFGAGPYPAAALATGSGAQDRDETVFGHKPFLVLADRLTKAGVAVVRWDDRGHGKSTGDFGTATTLDFASDAATAVAFLRARDDIDPAKVGVIGHSEGGIVAPMVAKDDARLAYIVLLAGPGVPGDEILDVQGAKIREASGADAESVARSRETQKKIFAILRSDLDDDDMRDALRPIIAAATRDEGVTDDDAVARAAESQIKLLMTPWFRFFLTYDPRDDLAKVQCPVLALNGKLDLQVWHEQNLPEIERVLESNDVDVTTRAYDGLNHLFQPARTGTIGEYATIETTFDESVLSDVTAWVTAKTAG